MVRQDYITWDIKFAVKMGATLQMTISSFFILLCVYLTFLQSSSKYSDTRTKTILYKNLILFANSCDLTLGSILALATNLTDRKLRRPIILSWVVLNTASISVHFFLCSVLYKNILQQPTDLRTDVHYLRISLSEIIYFACHLSFTTLVIAFLAYYNPVHKPYEPVDRNRVSVPTEPMYPYITTTESRHIRFSDSFVFNAVKFHKHEESHRSEASTSNNFLDYDTKSLSKLYEPVHVKPEKGNSKTL